MDACCRITDGPPPCGRDHQAVVPCLARSWASPERHSAWLVVGAQVKAYSRETHSPSRASKTYRHSAFQIIHIHTTVVNSGRAHTTQHSAWLELRMGIPGARNSNIWHPPMSHTVIIRSASDCRSLYTLIHNLVDRAYH